MTGATGRVGSLAVRRLLELYPKVLVRAVVNDLAKGSRLLKEEQDKYGIKLEVSELSPHEAASFVCCYHRKKQRVGEYSYRVLLLSSLCTPFVGFFFFFSRVSLVSFVLPCQILSADLGGKRSAAKVVEGASAVVFCASGFAQNLSPIQRYVRSPLVCCCSAAAVVVHTVVAALQFDGKSRIHKANDDDLPAIQTDGTERQNPAGWPMRYG